MHLPVDPATKTLKNLGELNSKLKCYLGATLCMS